MPRDILVKSQGSLILMFTMISQKQFSRFLRGLKPKVKKWLCISYHVFTSEYQAGEQHMERSLL